MKRNKGFPHRERKKVKTKLPDKRPHVSLNPAWRSEEAKDERSFCVPHIQVDHRSRRWNDTIKLNVWTRQEAHVLIDMWAEIAWGRRSKHHSAMSNMAGYFNKLWIKQRGCCAVTGIELHGAAGCMGHGIGIDIINADFGIRKGNIRLVSAPIAMIRLRIPNRRTQQLAALDPKDYVDWPVYWAIVKHIYWWFKDHQPFKWMPVQIDFPKPSTPAEIKKAQSQRSWYVPDWITLSWAICHGDECNRNDIDSWKLKSPREKFVNFAHFGFKDNNLHTSILKSTPYRHNINSDYHIDLCDPNIDLEKTVVGIAQLGFTSLFHFLFNLGKDANGNWR